MMLGLPVRQLNAASDIPFGYYEDENRPGWLRPEHFELRALLQARKYLEAGESLRTVCDWLVSATNRDISFYGMQRRINAYYPLDEIETLSQDDRERLTSASVEDYQTWKTDSEGQEKEDLRSTPADES